MENRAIYRKTIVRVSQAIYNQISYVHIASMICFAEQICAKALNSKILSGYHRQSG
jgi:hypothetical protein